MELQSLMPGPQALGPDNSCCECTTSDARCSSASPRALSTQGHRNLKTVSTLVEGGSCHEAYLWKKEAPTKRHTWWCDSASGGVPRNQPFTFSFMSR